MLQDRVFVRQGWLFGLLAAALLTGCGPSDGLVEVGGTVTFDGAPIPEGRILFRMTDGDQQAYSEVIENGKYLIRVAPGSARVEITASRLIPGKFVEVNPGEPEQVGEMYIPEKYNSRTELTATISGATESQNFDLTAN